MKKLISLFLETHRQSQALNSSFNISKELDLEALAVLEACRRNCRHYKKKSQRKFTSMLNRVLDSQLTLLLNSADLLNADVYGKLTAAIKNWCPWQSRQQVFCLKIKNHLLKLLPSVRQKQQLQKLCGEYRQHLQVDIETQLQRRHSQALVACSMRNTAIFAAPPQSNQPQARLVNDSRTTMDKIIADQNQYIVNPGKSLGFALEKYKVVTRLQESLNTPVKSAPEQLKDFRQKFLAERAILEKNRDRPSILFLKGIATLFSLGVAYLLGIWNVRGQQAAANLQQTLLHAGIERGRPS